VKDGRAHRDETRDVTVTAGSVNPLKRAPLLSDNPVIARALTRAPFVRVERTRCEILQSVHILDAPTTYYLLLTRLELSDMPKAL